MANAQTYSQHFNMTFEGKKYIYYIVFLSCRYDNAGYRAKDSCIATSGLEMLPF